MLYDSSRTPPHHPHHTASAGAPGRVPGLAGGANTTSVPGSVGKGAPKQGCRRPAGCGVRGTGPVLSCCMFLFFPMSQKSEDQLEKLHFLEIPAEPAPGPRAVHGGGERGAGSIVCPASSWVLSPEPQVRNAHSCRLALRPHPPRVGAKRGRAAGLGPGDRARPGEEGAGNAPSCFCTEN